MTKLLGLSEVSKMMHKSPKGMRLLMNRGKFPFTKIGGRLFTEEAELEKYLRLSRKTTAETAAGQEAA